MSDIITAKQDLIILPPETMLMPLQVVSGTMLEYMETAMKRAVVCDVTNDEELAVAAEIRNNMAKGRKHLKESVTNARRPVIAFADSISASVATLDANLGDSDGVIADKIKLYTDEREAARQAILAEQRRIEQARLNQEAAERRVREQAAAAAQAKAEAARREQERLAWEAQERERLAAEAIMNGKRNAKTVADNSAALAQAAEVERQAEQARLAAEQAEQEAAEAQRLAEQQVIVAPVVMQAAPAALGKVKGMKSKRVVEGLLYNVADGLPAIYLQVDEVLLKKHILDGAVTLSTPGVKAFQIAEILVTSGR